MSYYSGFLLAVPTANKQQYADHATKAWPMSVSYTHLDVYKRQVWDHEVGGSNPLAPTAEMWRVKSGG